jgi:imidazolonepropionase-like amidohydrolase
VWLKFARVVPLRALIAGVLVAAMPTPAASQQLTGLWDAHTHLSWYGESALGLLIDRGVTGVRDCGGDITQLRRWREDIAAGRRAGPRIYFSGPALDGPKDAPHRVTVRTPAEGRAAVRQLAADGADFVKTHNALDRDTYLAILDEAKAVGLRVASHLPRGIAAWDAAEAGAASIEHAAESLVASPIYAGAATTVEEAMAWWRGADGDKAIARLSATGAAVTPTLVTYEAFTERRKGSADYDGRRRVLAFALELTGRLHRAGIPILAGSDFAGPELPLAPGLSIQREVALLREAGLSEDAARAAAGENIRRWLER